MPLLEHKAQPDTSVRRTVLIRTGVWYDDRIVPLTFPGAWNVVEHWPATPAPLTDHEIETRMECPVGQPPLHQLARGKKRPLLIVDDLSRPTPAYRILPHVYRQLERAGIHPDGVRILVATGTHGEQDRRALGNKLGQDAMSRGHVLVHDDRREVRFAGKTSFGTPIYVNREVLRSDLLVGVSGVYPQHTAGFGGGSKLVLGVLGRKTIMYLHYGHAGAGGSYNVDNTFRMDLEEIAKKVELNTIVTAHVNADLDIVNLLCGDHFTYYLDAVAFSRKKYEAPHPGDSDIVVANGYPTDISYTFMRKGYKPLDLARSGAVRIMVASNHEGIGTHGFFPHMNPPPYLRYQRLYREFSVLGAGHIARKIVRKIRKTIGIPNPEEGGKAPSVPVEENYALPRNTKKLLLYHTNVRNDSMQRIQGIQHYRKWEDLLAEAIRILGKRNAKVSIYGCSPLQCIDAAPIPY